MCEACGCGEENQTYTHTHDGHTHSHSHSHDHSHDHEHHHHHDEAEKRTISVEQKVLAKNDKAAEINRKWLSERGIVAINLISSPGSGKTLLLEKTLEALKGKLNCAVIVGDQQTDNDAQRLMDKGAPVHQIQTISACHLNAEQIAEVLPEVADENTDILFIENVGNLVCPAAFELGEDFKVALLSTTEGEDKAEKYPVLFSKAQVAVITKTDLIPHLDWSISKCRESIRKVHPGMFTFELSAKNGEGMEQWIDYLCKLPAGA